jgi:hypothetical protein
MLISVLDFSSNVFTYKKSALSRALFLQGIEPGLVGDPRLLTQ